MTTTTMAEVTLPDGRAVVGPSGPELLGLWAEITGDSPLAVTAGELAAGDTVLDVGAHAGLSSVYVAGRRPGLRIIGFEPAPSTYDCLAENFARHVPGGTAVRYALGAAAGDRPFVFHPYLSSNSTLYADEADEAGNREAFFANTGTDPATREAIRSLQAVSQQTSVPVTTLTGVLGGGDIDEVALLKIDVERGELAVLDGLDESCWPRIRRILAEVHDLDGRLATVVARLRRHGMRVRTHQAPMYAGGSVHTVLAARP
ncbi:hypothetical protein ACTI_45270 [Actinoplanes sp. OR16]|uniref:FkbM family methyltransferase n=1 Tax=Actinoplanes sp. OR16 TaxID=946334 RepID=UPI000F6BE025|nr:FkbM family methyltransferase [Actinoplanes sp. OR16]BBH67842.1 hypothetical protein ACTI_45270 [Actinoplanes sp. OR16]